MTNPTRIVVSLTARSLRDAREELARAAQGGADMAEIRWDRWFDEDRRRIDELFPAPIPLLLTVRSRAEGGEGPEDPEERARIWESLAQLPWAGVDRELNRDSPRDRRDRGLARDWYSTHLPPGASIADLDRELERPFPADGIRKVVIRADLKEAVTEIFPRAQRAATRGITLLVTGPAGPLERAWADRLGLPFVLAAPPETGSERRTAPVEAAQLPSDRLRRAWDADPPAPLFAVVGRPIEHSQSPLIHHLWMDAMGYRGIYLALEPRVAEELRSILPDLAAGGFRGLNVTAPFKEAAANWAASASQVVARIGCANTLTFQGEAIRADNTDLIALQRRLQELPEEGRWDERELLVIGTGGAARAALAVGEDRGARTTLWGRDLSATEQLARRFGAEIWSPKRPIPDGALVIHATTVGRGDGFHASGIPFPELLSPHGHLLDFVYAPTDPAVRRAAEARGRSYESGTRLLVYQAAHAFSIWWGAPPSEELIASALTEVAPCPV
jgi:shikimate dehydrogenase